MAALKIWSIGKANQRIEELESQVATLTKERDEAKAALESNAGEISTAAEQVQRDLDTARQTIGTLTGELNASKTLIAAKDAEIAALGAKLENQSQQVRVQVAQQVATTQAALGQPPMPSAPATAKTATNLTGAARVRAMAKADLDAAGYKQPSSTN